MSLTNKETIRLMIDGKTLKDKKGNLFKWERESFYSMFREGNKHYWQVENSMLEMLGGLEIYEPEKDGEIEKLTKSPNQTSLTECFDKINELIDTVNELKARQG